MESITENKEENKLSSEQSWINEESNWIKGMQHKEQEFINNMFGI